MSENKMMDMRQSPLGRATEAARQYRVTREQKYIDEIRGTLNFYPVADLEVWIQQHCFDSPE